MVDEYKEIKAGVEGLGDVPEPGGETVTETVTETIPETTYSQPSYSTPGYSQEYPTAPSKGLDMEMVHEVIEAVVNEKWDEQMGKVGNIAVWKEKITNDVVAIKQELVRLEENFRGLQNAILGKVRDYDTGIKSVYSEMKALEKVFEKILEPLTSNIKDLNRITEELKKVKR